MGLPEGARLGPYEVLASIGAGGMGEVYRARDARLERDVAIKVLPASSSGDDHARARLLREARAAAALSHPHLCTIHEVGETDGHVYIAMELVHGERLDRLVAGGPLPEEQVVRLGCQIADAMAHAHERGIVHRDLKPANVVVSARQHAKVLDFGLAKRLPSTADFSDTPTETVVPLTRAHQVVGTLLYMAPELLRGEPADTRSDVWALGVLLHEMASGVRPFGGRTEFEIASAILGDAAVTIADTVPERVRGIVAKCLAKEPAARYRDAGDVRAALEAVGTVTRTRTARPARWGTAAAVAAVVVAVAAIGFAVRDRLVGARGPKVDSIAVLPLENVSGNADDAYLAEGVQDALITQLAELHGLTRVTERRSAARLTDPALTIPQIARRLGVKAVVAGSVLRSAGRVRVAARLVDGATEAHLWARTYERSDTDLLALQNDIVSSIAQAIELRLDPAARDRLEKPRAFDRDAYESYLRGMYFVHKPGFANTQKGLTYLQDAVDRDPGNAQVYAGLAMGHAELGHSPAASPDSWTRARAAAERAVALDPGLADGYAALADVKLYWDWDWAGAERAFMRANELNPSLAMNHYHYAWYLALMDRLDEAIVEHKRAQELDPLTAVHTGWLGELYRLQGRYDDGIAEARKAIDINPKAVVGWQVLARASWSKGAHAQAIEAATQAAALGNLATLGVAYAYAGRLDEAKKILADLEGRPPIPIYSAALSELSAAIGDLDRAFKWLSYEPHHAFVPWARINPEYAPLRKDPRFVAFLARLKLPPPKGVETR